MADTKDANAKGAGESSAQSSAAGKDVLSLVLVAVNLIALGLGGALLYKGTLGWERPSLREEQVAEDFNKERESAEEAVPLIYSMDQITVNLSGYPPRVVRITPHLVMLDKDGFEEVVQLGAHSRDAIQETLSSRTYADIDSIQGKLELKDKIKSSLNKIMHRGVVKDVYFSEFLVQ